MASCSCWMICSSPILPSPLKTLGNHLRISSSLLDTVVIIADSPRRLVCRSRLTKTVCFESLLLKERTAVNWLMVLRGYWAGPNRTFDGFFSLTSCSPLSISSDMAITRVPVSSLKGTTLSPSLTKICHGTPELSMTTPRKAISSTFSLSVAATV